MFTTTRHSHTDDGPGQPDRLGPPIDDLLDTLACSSAAQWDAARCRHTDDDAIHLFFSDDIADINQAKRVCSDCPVAVPCVAGALQRHEPCGVWGGFLFKDGQIQAHKRPRGRPPKNRPAQDLIQLTAHHLTLTHHQISPRLAARPISPPAAGSRSR